ncbi:hypothetical protein ABIA60_001611 [Pseudomonas frederiksbergensis]
MGLGRGKSSVLDSTEVEDRPPSSYVSLRALLPSTLLRMRKVAYCYHR